MIYLKFIVLTFLTCSELVLAQPKVVHRDELVFKVGSDFYFLSDLNIHWENLKLLECAYPENLLIESIAIFKRFDKLALDKILKSSLNPQNGDTSNLELILITRKMHQFLASQKIELNPGLEEIVFQSITNNSCTDRKIDESFKQGLRSVLILEVFLRSRLGILKSDDKLELETVHNFLGAVDKQIKHEYFFEKNIFN